MERYSYCRFRHADVAACLGPFAAHRGTQCGTVGNPACKAVRELPENSVVKAFAEATLTATELPFTGPSRRDRAPRVAGRSRYAPAVGHEAEF